MPEALCFDMYGTLCDTDSVGRELAERVDAPAGLIADVTGLWRAKQLQYSYQVSLMDDYHPFWDVTAEALDYALDYYGIDSTAIDKDAILAAYEQLEPFEDALPALERLDGDADVALAVLSNGNTEMLEVLCENTGLASHLDAIVSADEVGTFKPHPAVYRNAADRLDLDLEACWLVSSNAWDVAGAAHAGMGAAWVNRRNDPPERIGGEATVELDGLTDLIDAIG